MTTVNVRFDLPEGMTEQDLFVFLRDAIGEFPNQRGGYLCGGVEAYVRKAYGFLSAEQIQKKIQEVEKRISWARELGNQNYPMTPVPEEEWKATPQLEEPAFFAQLKKACEEADVEVEWFDRGGGLFGYLTCCRGTTVGIEVFRKPETDKCYIWEVRDVGFLYLYEGPPNLTAMMEVLGHLKPTKAGY